MDGMVLPLVTSRICFATFLLLFHGKVHRIPSLVKPTTSPPPPPSTDNTGRPCAAATHSLASEQCVLHLAGCKGTFDAPDVDLLVATCREGVAFADADDSTRPAVPMLLATHPDTPCECRDECGMTPGCALWGFSGGLGASCLLYAGNTQLIASGVHGRTTGGSAGCSHPTTHACDTTRAPATALPTLAPHTTPPTTSTPPAPPLTLPPTNEPTEMVDLLGGSGRSSLRRFINVAAVMTAVTGAVPLSGQRLALLANTHCGVSAGEAAVGIPFVLNPVGVSIGEGPDGVHTGSVVASLAIVSAGAVVLHTLAVSALHRASGSDELAKTKGLMHYPGASILVPVALLQGVSNSGMRMVVSGTGFLAIGAVTGAFCLAFTGYIFLVLERKRFERKCSFRREVLPDALLVNFFRPRGVWVSETHRVTEGHFTERFGALFARFRAGCENFIVFEMCLTLLISVVGGLEVSSATKCGHKRAVLAVITGIFLATLLIFRPHRIRFSNLCAAASLIFQTLGLIFSAIAFYDGTEGHWGFEASLALFVVAAVFLLCQMLNELLQYFFDRATGRTQRSVGDNEMSQIQDLEGRYIPLVEGDGAQQNTTSFDENYYRTLSNYEARHPGDKSIKDNETDNAGHLGTMGTNESGFSWEGLLTDIAGADGKDVTPETVIATRPIGPREPNNATYSSPPAPLPLTPRKRKRSSLGLSRNASTLSYVNAAERTMSTSPTHKSPPRARRSTSMVVVPTEAARASGDIGVTTFEQSIALIESFSTERDDPLEEGGGGGGGGREGRKTSITLQPCPSNNSLRSVGSFSNVQSLRRNSTRGSFRQVVL